MTVPTATWFSSRHLLVLLSACALLPHSTHQTEAAEQVCVVATVQPLATEAGVAAFRQGGNAVDAAIAAALTLGVVDSPNSGLGGGCFILIRKPDGTILAIDGREKALADLLLPTANILHGSMEVISTSWKVNEFDQ